MGTVLLGNGTSVKFEFVSFRGSNQASTHQFLLLFIAVGAFALSIFELESLRSVQMSDASRNHDPVFNPEVPPEPEYTVSELAAMEQSELAAIERLREEAVRPIAFRAASFLHDWKNRDYVVYSLSLC